MTTEFETRELQRHALENLQKMRRELAARSALLVFYGFMLGIVACNLFHIHHRGREVAENRQSHCPAAMWANESGEGGEMKKPKQLLDVEEGEPTKTVTFGLGIGFAGAEHRETFEVSATATHEDLDEDLRNWAANYIDMWIEDEEEK